MEEFDLCRKVRSVNGTSPDENGNVTLTDIYELKDSEYKSTSLRFTRGFFMGFNKANLDLSGGVLDWDAVHQSPTVDKFSNLMFFSNSNSYGRTRIGCVKWDSQDYERTSIGRTAYGLDFAHQGLSVYRPTVNDDLLLGCIACHYTESGSADYTKCNIFNLWKITVNGSKISYSLHKRVKLLKENSYNTNASVQSAITYDGKYLIIYYTGLDGNKQFAIWTMETVMNAQNNQDISDDTYNTFASPHGSTSICGQGLYSDGKYIYCLRGNASTGIYVISLDGKDISSSFYIRHTLSLEDYPQVGGEYPTTCIPEAEGIFWADYHGITKMIVCVAQKATYPNGHLGRYMSFFDLTDGDIDNSAYTPIRGATVGITNADDILGGNVLVFTGVQNLPVNTTGYLQSHYYPVETQKCRQFYSGLNNADNHLYTRLVDPNSTGTTPWRKFVTTDRTDNVISVTTNTRSPGSEDLTTYSMIFKLQNYKEPNQGNGENYGYLSRYRQDKEPGSTNIQTAFKLGSVEGGSAGDGGFSFNIYQNLGTVSSAKYYFTKDNVASLGDSTHRWSNVYATKFVGDLNGNADSATTADNGVDSQGDNWIRFKNGVQMCWGVANATRSGYLNTLPKAFVNSSYTLNATYTGTIETLNISVARTSSSTFTVYQSYNENELTVDYIAIGKWK